MNLSEHFTLAELTRTNHPIANTPTPYIINNLRRLCHDVLEPARIMLDQPIIITSGYRCRVLNNRVGGAKNSYHLQGLAADIHICDTTFAKTLMDIFALNRHVDLALWERSKTGDWLHVQTSDKPRHLINRNYKT